MMRRTISSLRMSCEQSEQIWHNSKGEKNENERLQGAYRKTRTLTCIGGNIIDRFTITGNMGLAIEPLHTVLGRKDHCHCSSESTKSGVARNHNYNVAIGKKLRGIKLISWQTRLGMVRTA